MTLHEGDCLIGDLGFFKDVRSWTECKARCVDCARCAVLSWSARRNDCSWYSSCDLSNLRRPPASARDYGTLRLKSAPARLPPPRSRTAPRQSLALVTLAAGSGVSCALTQWCYRAERRMARALRYEGSWRVSLFVIGADSLSSLDCPTATLVPVDERVIRAMETCAAQEGGGHSTAAGSDVNFYKLTALGFRQFDLVLFVDVDITLVPLDDLDGLAKQWSVMAKMFAAGRKWPTFIANADQASPVNGGLWLARPSQRAFSAALRTLSQCRFNKSHGWEFAGRPRELLQHLAVRHPDGELATRDLRDNPNSTVCMRRNDWSFHGAHTDQVSRCLLPTHFLSMTMPRSATKSQPPPCHARASFGTCSLCTDKWARTFAPARGARRRCTGTASPFLNHGSGGPSAHASGGRPSAQTLRHTCRT